MSAGVPQVEEVIVKSDFDRIVTKVQEVWASLPEMDYEALHTELSSLNVAISDSPSLQKVAQDMIRVQAVLTRATQIKIMSDRDYSTKKNIVKTLASGWVKFSTETSQDKRKAEAEVKLWQFFEALSEAEILDNAAASIVDNLHTKYEAISRLVSVFQLQVKLSEFGGTRVLPDATFSRNFDEKEGDEAVVEEETSVNHRYDGWPESPDAT